jgi:hypothetical protein
MSHASRFVHTVLALASMTLCASGLAQTPAVPESTRPVASGSVTVAQAAVIARVEVSARRPVHGTLRGVLAATGQGPDALRRYIYMTRGIYGYRFDDFAKLEWYD